MKPPLRHVAPAPPSSFAADQKTWLREDAASTWPTVPANGDRSRVINVPPDEPGFLVTYGPDPRIWCVDCHKHARLKTHVDGSLRSTDVEQVKHSHVCGPPGSPWDAEG